MPLTYNMKKDILIIAAMKTELPPIAGAIVTGFGKEKTRKILIKEIKEKKPSLVISVGVVGAVVPELKAGDLFVPEAVVDYENAEKKYQIDFPIDKKGVLVTVHKVFEREDKYKLKQIIPDAICVDMETSAVCSVLEPLGIPLLCVKAVSDELDFDFKDKGLLNENIKKAVNNYSEYLCRILKQIS